MSTSKTLPMKFKAMHYALLAYITQSDEFTPEAKIGLIAKLPVHDSVENQVIFYEKMVDFKTVEKDIVKPMMKKKKQDETAAAKPVKEKKPRATKTTATTPVAPTPTPTPTPAVPVAPVAEEKPKKKRVVKKKAEQPNTTTPEQMEEKAQEEMMSLTDEMKEEPYQPVTLTPAAPAAPPPPPPPLAKATKKKETTSVKKAVVKKAVKAAVAVAEVEEKSDVEEPELEKYLIIRDGVRYWTSDEFEKNGEVYEYCIDSEGDGCAGNVAIGCLKDGKLILN